jgi:hypothetical protein
MKKGLVVVSALLLSACTGSIGQLGMFEKNAPRILSGDDSQVLLYDANGLSPEGTQGTADKYCARYGKTAEWQSRGGADSDCISNQLNYCATYICK